jgi:catechol 2,3-dioxygenase-like lactoylglutathione lyase family enzyme
MMVGAAPVVAVTDVAKSIAYYRDALGFAVRFEYGAPTFYVCLCRDDVDIHLVAAAQTKRLPGNSGVAVFVDDVDGLHAELVKRGAQVTKAPQNYDYGMREFNVSDPDGNELFFGMSTEKEK